MKATPSGLPTAVASDDDLEHLATACAQLLLSWHRKHAQVDATEDDTKTPSTNGTEGN